MGSFEIVAHRGAHEQLPENSLAAFEQAVALGADAVELDVRLSADGEPFVFHFFYLDAHSTLSGPIFDYAAAHLRAASLRHPQGGEPTREPIPSLHQVLETFAGRIGLEIEVKGPEPESAAVVARALQAYRPYWDSFEVTSYEPLLLREIRAGCPGLAVDLLFPRPEPWMRPDVVAHMALQRARLAGARAVHLHPDQLDPAVLAGVRAGQVEVHSWDVNTPESLRKVWELGISRIDTDCPEQALAFRRERNQ